MEPRPLPAIATRTARHHAGKSAARQADVAVAVSDLAGELLEIPHGASQLLRRALARLAERLGATDAAVWVAAGTTLQRALHVAPQATADDETSIEVLAAATALERFRHNSLIVCGAGDVAGIEPLVPDGVRSFVAASSRRQPVSGVLVLGRRDATPPCDRAAAAHLRIAAALFERALTSAIPAAEPSRLNDAILGALPGALAVLDRRGVIVATNVTWRLRPRHFAMTRDAEAGMSYVDLLRTAAAGSPDAGSALAGIEAVGRGAASAFEMAYTAPSHGDERWFTMTVTPLQRPEDGAVVVHAEVSQSQLLELARRISEDRFQQLADSLPLPVWMVSADGLVMFGNQAWSEASGGSVRRGDRWSAASHPDDRALADAAFQSAIARRGHLEVEFRVEAADGAYRWWTWLGAPCFNAGGELAHYVGTCVDATVRRHAQQALHELGAKLVAAQEAERSRIARELHDDLGQQVALLASKLDMLTHRRQPSRHHMLAGVTEARQELQQLASSIHSLSHELHPARLRLLGLEQTLRSLCRDMSAESGKHIRFDARDIAADLAENTALCIFRVTQEAIQNAVKHSGTRVIEVTVEGTPEHVTLRVRDAGTGFDPLSPGASGIGLLTMRERVELIGGRLKIDTAPARGTVVEAVVPATTAA